MSKNIAIADDVYEALKRRKGDRSFSEALRDLLEGGGHVADVVGRGALEGLPLDRARRELHEAGRGTLERLPGRSGADAPR